MPSEAQNSQPNRVMVVEDCTRATLEKAYTHTIALIGRRATADRVARLIQNDFTEGRIFCARVRLEFVKTVRQQEAA